MVNLIRNSLEVQKTIQITDYLHNALGIPLQITSGTIITIATQHILLRQLQDKIAIELDNNFMFSGFKLVDLIALIEDGNTEISGYPLLSKCAECINDNMEQIYYEWKEGY